MKSVLFVLSLLLITATHSFSQNQRPVAVNDTVVGMPGYPVKVNLIKNDYDPDGDSIYVESSHSLLRVNDTCWQIMVYESEPAGFDSIYKAYYRLRDSEGSLDVGYIVVILKGIAKYDFVDINNIRALVSPFGTHFFDGENNCFEVPKGSGKQSMFLSGLWIAGYDDSLHPHYAADRYRQGGADFFVGPVSDRYDSLYNLKWNRVWKISRQQIRYHIENWAQPGYKPVEVISNWPAHGDPKLGQSARIAPFYDSDADGIYDPFKGDYPLIRGDQAVFLIRNDLKKPHTLTKSNPLGIEIHEMVYAFDRPDDSTLNNTLFIHTDILKLKPGTISNTYMGIYNDFDLGFGLDDYIGTDVTNGILYAYNGDPVDGTNDSTSYGEHPPAIGLKIIGGPYLDPDGMDNPSGYCDGGINGLNFGDGIADNERMGLMHTTSFRYTNSCPTYGDIAFYPYNELSRATWFGSTCEINLCDTSFSSGIGPYSNFVFPGNSDTLCFWGTNGQRPLGGYYIDGKYWTEQTVENLPGDRRAVASMGPVTLNEGDIIPLDYCFTWARDYQGDNLSSVDLLRERMAGMNTSWNTLVQLPDDLYGPKGDPVDEHLLVYPNPSRYSIKVISTLNTQTTYFIFDLSGKPVKSGNLQKGENTLDISHLAAGIYFIKCGTQVARIEKL